MRYRVEPFKPYHLDVLIAQGIQPAQHSALDGFSGKFENQAFPGNNMTVYHGDSILLCGGIFPMAPKVGRCWALLSDQVSPHMHWLHFATKRFLSTQDWRRLEATVESGFEAGCKWVKLLKFEYEGAMRGFGMNGETHLMFARVT